MPAKQTENDQWHKQTPANQATQQMAEIYLLLFEVKKSLYLFGSQCTKAFTAWLRIQRGLME